MQEPPDDTSVLDAEAERAIPFGAPRLPSSALSRDERASRSTIRGRSFGTTSERVADRLPNAAARAALRGIAPRHLLGRPGSVVSTVCRCGTACRVAVVCWNRIEIGDFSEPSGVAAWRQLESHDRSTRGMTCQTGPRCARTTV